MPNRPNKKSKNMSEEAKTVDLDLGDFSAIVRIIDVASERGAFKGAELSSVGAVRDKFAEFIDHHTPKKEEEDEATTDGAEATEETSE